MARKKYTILDTWKYRRPERSLLFWSFLAIVTGYIIVILSKTGHIPSDWRDFIPLAIYVAAMLTIHGIFVLFKFRGDPILLAAVFFLAGFGMLAQFRMGSYTAMITENLSSIAFPAGMGLMLLVVLLFRKGRYRLLEPFAIPSACGAILMLSAIFVWGQRYRGALFMPGYSNPADIVKILLVVFVAGFLTRSHKDLQQTAAGFPMPSFATISILLLLWGIPMVLLLLQRDLGMLVLLNAVLIVLLYVATGRFRYLMLGLFFAWILGMVMFTFSLHSQARFQAWFNPLLDPTGKGWQILQALSAMYSGGLWGMGLGEGSPQFIPIASTDFIYAVIGEELGYAGCGIVLFFYFVLFYRGYQIAVQLKSQFGILLGTGIVTTLAIQTLLNIGGVVKALPLTGITLPFISHGGSSLVTTFLGVGLLLALSEREVQTDAKGGES